MCTSPLHILPTKTLGMSYDVPCGECLECRSLSQNSWVTRLGFDLSDLYANGGKAIFLTFTYNDDCLPWTNFGFVDEDRVPCFSHDDVLRFLNKLKVYVNRKYGKGQYKYFWCSEYGKYTRRPHYHALFMLKDGVDSTWFAETCRSLWDYGFMFPRYKNGRYVDNNGCTSSVELRNRQSACKYVSKYITKDLDYCKLDVIKKYLDVRKNLKDDVRRYYNKCLPKHFQSKGIGSSAFKHGCSPDLLLSFVRNGIYNPTTCKMDQLPRYYVEKYCFDHKRVKVDDDYSYVVRSLRSDYEIVIREVTRQSFLSKLHQLDNFYHNVNLNVFKAHGYTLSDFVKFQRLQNSYSSEYFICRYWYDNLTLPCKTIYDDMFDGFTIDNLVDFRLLLYRLEVDIIHTKDINRDSDVYWFMSVFNNIVRSDRALANKQRYDDYMRQKKLKFIQLHLINK
jgi:hypothetical protein